MDLSFTPEQEAYRLSLRRWLEVHLPADWGGPRFTGPDDPDENAAFQADFERRLHAAGFQGVHWPVAYGGRGLGAVEQLVVAEELGRRAAPEFINAIGKELVGPVLMAVGSEAQKRHYLPRILGLDDIWCQGFSEPNAGSDLAAIETRAVRDGDDFVVSGQKLWTSYARHANKCILLARTDPAAPKHRGLTLFMADMTAPGITIRPLAQITGRAEFNEVFLDEVRIPASEVLGEVDGGWHAAVTVLGFERATTRLYRQQRFQHEFDELLHRCGDAFARDGHLRDRAGAVAADLAVLRLLNLKTVSRIAEGRDIGSEASLIKLFWSELHQRMAALAMDAFGERFGDDPAAERFRHVYLQSRAETLYAGTSQIQRNIIAERVLGLPR